MAASRRRELIPYVILLASLVVTAATARYAAVTGGRQDQLLLGKEAEGVIGAIVNRLDNYVAMLRGGAGLFAASNDVTRDEFRAYVQRLELERRYPGIQGIGFSMRIRAEERNQVRAAVKRHVPWFEFWPEPTGSEFNAILYLEPDDVRNRRALGFDMASEPNRAMAMSRARDSGAPVATARVRLVQEGDDAKPQAGFLIYVPVYRDGTVPATAEQRQRALLGFVYSPFRVDDLLEGIAGTQQLRAVSFEVFDGETVDDPGRLMHSSTQTVTTRRFEYVRTIRIAEQPWAIRVHSNTSMRGSADRLVVGADCRGRDGVLVSAVRRRSRTDPGARLGGAHGGGAAAVRGTAARGRPRQGRVSGDGLT